MRKCPWCHNKAIIKNSPLGYFVECERNGHIHNIGVLVSTKRSFSKTEREAEELWDNEVENITDRFRISSVERNYVYATHIEKCI